MLKCWFKQEDGQAFAEYLLVFGVIAVALAGLIWAWKLPLEEYLNTIARTIAKTR
ncbi:Flp family type IVb pilin [bacterium]|nr:Flp family type IVb pilin [bacterium]